MRKVAVSIAATFLGATMAAGCAGSVSDGANGSEDDSAYTVATPVAARQSTAQSVPGATIDVAALSSAPAKAAARDPLFMARLHTLAEQITEKRPSVPAAPSAPTGAATVKPMTLDVPERGLAGFEGLNAFDNDTTGVGGAITPPDQANCEGNGWVLEGTNSSMRVYNILGQAVGGPISANDFFGIPQPTATSTTIEFPSDPKCYFDKQTNRFFATTLDIVATIDPMTGAETLVGSKLIIAVSQGPTPTGKFKLFTIDATDDGTNGTASNPGCPCLGDQPLLGADANGFYVTTNEFSLTGPIFNGSQVYAMSKAALVAGRAPSVVHLSNLVLAEGIGISLQPAISPTGTIDPAGNGTQYFLSSLDFSGTYDNRVALWALSNTASLDAATPSVSLTHAVLASEVYGSPAAASQKDGPAPLRDCLNSGNCTTTLGIPKAMSPEVIEQVDTNDDRMNQVYYAGGKLWSAIDTDVLVGKNHRAALAWISVQPKHLASGQLGAKVQSQGYVAFDGIDAMYPSIALTDDGRGAMVFSVSGGAHYPSSAYARFDAFKPTAARIAGEGAAPLDSWDGYATFNGGQAGPARYGDYSAAFIDGTTVWMASEWVATSCTTLPCDGRDVLTNWSTFVSRLDLDY
jgi:hypothetical protein